MALWAPNTNSAHTLGTPSPLYRMACGLGNADQCSNLGDMPADKSPEPSRAQRNNLGIIFGAMFLHHLAIGHVPNPHHAVRGATRQTLSTRVKCQTVV